MNKKLKNMLAFVAVLASTFLAVSAFGNVSQAQQNIGQDWQMNRNQGNYNQYNRDEIRNRFNNRVDGQRGQYIRNRALGITLNTPAFSRSQNVVLRGMAFGSNRVRMYVNGRFIGTAPVNNGRYEKAVRLRSGMNRVRVTIMRGPSAKTVMRIVRVR